MLTVLVLALEGTASLVTTGLLDTLQMADRAGISQSGASRLFDVQLTGLTRKPVQLQNGSNSCQRLTSTKPLYRT